MAGKTAEATVFSSDRFPSFTFAGHHGDIGAQYGDSCRALIHTHLGQVVARLDGLGADRAEVLRRTVPYRDVVERHAPWLDAEIRGVAEGAGLTVEEAYILQLRAELLAAFKPRLETSECTTFAASGSATGDGTGLMAQNADLPASYTDVCVVVRLVPSDGPTVLMVTPAGQVSYIGISSTGIGVMGNFLVCDGWKVGFPRYLLTRVALASHSAQAAQRAVEALPRAASRNLTILDSTGSMVGVETVPRATGIVAPVNDVLTHANHFLSPALAAEERSEGERLRNSHRRQQRIEQLVDADHGRLDAARAQKLLRDRSGAPDCLSIGETDLDHGTMTVASVIAEPSRGRMWVAKGPPHEHDYVVHELDPPEPETAR